MKTVQCSVLSVLLKNDDNNMADAGRYMTEDSTEDIKKLSCTFHYFPQNTI